MLLEWGTVEDQARPGRKAQWIQDMSRLLATPGGHFPDRHSSAASRQTIGAKK